MNKLILGSILYLFSAFSHAEIQVQIEPSSVTMEQSFQLIITPLGSHMRSIPDLSGLQKDFIILATERNVNYSVYNGQSMTISQWVITLKALKSGVLTIPSIKIGTEKSTPITINVEPAKAQDGSAAAQQQDLMLTAEVNVEKPYVNQQIIYTVTLYNSKRLLDAAYQAPQVQDALLIPLGDARSYQTVKNNISYIAEEQKYAIYPQKSGSLKIISPSFTALVYDTNPQRIKVQDKTIELNIQPIPKQYQGATWLPAKFVHLTEQYEYAGQTLNQGSTLVRTVTLEAGQIPAQLLPKINFAAGDGFSVYPEKGADKNQVRQGELVGSTEFKVTYLFNKPGKIILPEIQIHWFNTYTGKDEIALLAPRSIDITAALGASNTNPVPKKTNDKPNAANPVTTPVNPAPAVVAPTAQDSNWIWYLALFFAVAWLVTLGLWGWQRKGGRFSNTQYNTALEQLKRACTACNPQQARDALLIWARLHWSDAKILNLTDLAYLVRDPQLKKQLQILSKVLYKSNEKVLWRGDELLRAVYAIKRNKTGVNDRRTILPPINPS